jgi:DNA replication licensing factor MCM7
LLSRFDLIFLLLDKADNDLDIALAKHVTNVHKSLVAPSTTRDMVDQEVMRSFIAKA